ncbi:MAG: right-handed parallel beta-helix repeat-containing protein, partial [Ignavibacteriaceae bacterium]
PIVLYGSNITVYKNYCFNFRRGIGVYHSNSLVRKNVLIMDVEGASGIRVEAFTSSYTPLIDSNYIENVYAYGIYKFISSSPTIKNNVINVKHDKGIGIAQSGNVKVYNNTILNVGSAGIDNFIISNVTVNNNYIMGNPSSYGIKVMPSSVVKNNAVTNTGTGIGKYGTTNPVVQYNNSYNNDINYENGINPDTTNLSIDPMVVNDDSTQGPLNFHLQMFSPLIDAGDPTILDRDGSRSDIGLYGGPYGESYIYADLPPRPPVNLTVNVDTLIKLKWNRNTEADFSYYNLYRDTTSNFQIDSTKLVVSLPDTFYNHIIPTGVESLYFKLTAVDNQENESNPSEEVGVLITSVKDEWKALNNYVLYQNYPNPFNPSTKIGYKLKERGYVKLYVYDIKGELVTILVNQTQEAGYYEVEFNAEVGNMQSAVGKSLASGVYIYQIFVKGENNIPVFSDIKKMLLVK